MRQPRRDTRGIVDPATLLRQVAFRRAAPAPALADLVEHYWFIDWDLAEPYAQHVLGHPAVNLVIMRADAGAPVTAEVAGIARATFSITLSGRGWVRGVQFRPGGFHPFSGRSPAPLTDRRLPLARVLPAAEAAVPAVAGAATDDAAARALDRLLLDLRPLPDEATLLAAAVTDRVRTDRSLRRVDEVARAAGLSVRALQRLFLDRVGVGPKWVLLRYRIQEALERAAPQVDWAGLADELGYADQAHLVRDFTAAVGMPPAAYAAVCRSAGPPAPLVK
ncbi:AraC family transcriptional regulator [Catellatospora sp. TT07R-123]|uniref:helix-turn-helix domain-containing protein n=1 Tax=Catellatospora sp. TT07R-123 TaxID=2733863 RepID=UPI001B0C7D7A|nr:AraC family transcriptional regulator [Catellatospora sp. TT07R-123]GHJ43667.1 AraC family transcriptional regulator [Catellatospora sp. TT07R-123]